MNTPRTIDLSGITIDALVRLTTVNRGRQNTFAVRIWDVKVTPFGLTVTDGRGCRHNVPRIPTETGTIAAVAY